MAFNGNRGASSADAADFKASVSSNNAPTNRDEKPHQASVKKPSQIMQLFAEMHEAKTEEHMPSYFQKIEKSVASAKRIAHEISLLSDENFAIVQTRFAEIKAEFESRKALPVLFVAEKTKLYIGETLAELNKTVMLRNVLIAYRELAEIATSQLEPAAKYGTIVAMAEEYQLTALINTDEYYQMIQMKMRSNEKFLGEINRTIDKIGTEMRTYRDTAGNQESDAGKAFFAELIMMYGRLYALDTIQDAFAKKQYVSLASVFAEIKEEYAKEKIKLHPMQIDALRDLFLMLPYVVSGKKGIELRDNLCAMLNAMNGIVDMKKSEVSLSAESKESALSKEKTASSADEKSGEAHESVYLLDEIIQEMQECEKASTREEYLQRMFIITNGERTIDFASKDGLGFSIQLDILVDIQKTFQAKKAGVTDQVTLEAIATAERFLLHLIHHVQLQNVPSVMEGLLVYVQTQELVKQCESITAAFAQLGGAAFLKRIEDYLVFVQARKSDAEIAKTISKITHTWSSLYKAFSTLEKTGIDFTKYQFTFALLSAKARTFSNQTPDSYFRCIKSLVEHNHKEYAEILFDIAQRKKAEFTSEHLEQIQNMFKPVEIQRSSTSEMLSRMPPQPVARVRSLPEEPVGMLADVHVPLASTATIVDRMPEQANGRRRSI